MRVPTRRDVAIRLPTHETEKHVIASPDEIGMRQSRVAARRLLRGSIVPRKDRVWVLLAKTGWGCAATTRWVSRRHWPVVIASPDAIGTRNPPSPPRLLRRLRLLAKTGEGEIARPGLAFRSISEVPTPDCSCLIYQASSQADLNGGMPDKSGNCITRRLTKSLRQ